MFDVDLNFDENIIFYLQAGDTADRDIGGPASHVDSELYLQEDRFYVQLAKHYMKINLRITSVISCLARHRT